MSATQVPPRSTADARRATVVARAVRVFAQAGYHATPVTEVADAAGISQAYVFRLFAGKLGLFVAALDHCFAQIEQALEAGADRVPDGSPAEILEAMGDAYADLIADRDLLMLQVHAQSAAGEPQIREALRRGYAGVVEVARRRSRANDSQVQQFVAYGQLCHLIVTADLDSIDQSWAKTLTGGMRHVGRRQADDRQAGPG